MLEPIFMIASQDLALGRPHLSRIIGFLGDYQQFLQYFYP
jgi:hypothetical protein